MFKVKLCKIEGCNNPSFSKQLCKNHAPKKAFKVTNFLKINIKQKKLDQTPKLTLSSFYLSIWNTRSHRSEVSDVSLGKEPLSVFFHHILPKKKYPELVFVEENIILLTLEEHDNVENDMYKYIEVNNRRKNLLDKYGLI